MRTLACVALAAVLTAASGARGASAMTMELRGDQLVASGRVVPEDGVRFRALIDTNPSIKTVVLWNSPGGSAGANDSITATIETHGLDTVVAGYCVSACAMIFLAGHERAFGDLEPLRLTSLGFHGSYVRGGLASDRRLNALKARVLERTGGKIDPALVDRWLHIADERSSVRFRYPGANASADASATPAPAPPATFFCAAGRAANAGEYGACEAIPGVDALAAGIVTSTKVVHVNR